MSFRRFATNPASIFPGKEIRFRRLNAFGFAYWDRPKTAVGSSGEYGVATISRPLKIIGLSGSRAL